MLNRGLICVLNSPLIVEKTTDKPYFLLKIFQYVFLGLKQSCSAMGSLTAVADEVDVDTQKIVADSLLGRTNRLAA